MTRVQNETLEALRACDGAITAGMLAEMAGITYKTAVARLGSLVTLGLAECITYDRSKVWLLVEAEAPHDQKRIRIEEAAPGRHIVRFGNGWKPQPAIRPRHGIGVSSSLAAHIGGAE